MGKRTSKRDSRQLQLPLGKPGAAKPARTHVTTGRPEEPAAVFVSYTSADQHLADQFIAALDRVGANHWVFRGQMDGSATWPAQVIGALRESTNFFACLSRAGASSKHVLREMLLAMEFDLPVHAFVEDDAFLLDEHHYVLAGQQRFPLYPLSGVETQVRLALAIEPPENQAARRAKWIARSKRKFTLDYKR